MDTKTEPLTREDLVLTLSRRIAAPRAMVFRAWTDPAQIRRWSAPHGFVISDCDGDLRPGGGWRATMQAPDGTVHRLLGVYRAVEPPARLVFSHAWLSDAGQPGPETLVTVTLEEDGAGTLLRLRQEGFANAALRDGHAGGWTETLERLDVWMADVAAAPQDEPVIRSVRVIEAPRARVWEAWTDPAHVSNWWGPRGFTTTTEAWDLRPGGAWRFVMHGPDGTDYPNLVVFDVVSPPERLSWRHAGVEGTEDVRFHATVEFVDLGPRTRVTLTARFADVRERDHLAEVYGAVAGGRETLERLAEHLARG